jgi:hypothetical protein
MERIKKKLLIVREDIEDFPQMLSRHYKGGETFSQKLIELLGKSRTVFGPHPLPHLLIQVRQALAELHERISSMEEGEDLDIALDEVEYVPLPSEKGFLVKYDQRTLLKSRIQIESYFKAIEQVKGNVSH